MNDTSRSGASGRENWNGPLGFILASAGAAIGLGNIWRFPYITGENGGAAFVLMYFGCVLLISLPVMLAEMAIGRHTGCGVLLAFKKILAEHPAPRAADYVIAAATAAVGVYSACRGGWGLSVLLLAAAAAWLKWSWKCLGVFCFVGGFMVISFYSVVGGWLIGYFVKVLSGTLEVGSVENAGLVFEAFNDDHLLVVFYTLVFMVLTFVIVARGVQKGIELSSKILMPLLFLLLLVLAVRFSFLPGAGKGYAFLFAPDFSKLNTRSFLMALGHAFFSLSVGIGCCLTYGSYVKKEDHLLKSTLIVVLLDTMAAILAGVAIFPALFAFDQAPEQGPRLLFQIFPVTLNRLPGGMFWVGTFFFLMVVAALTSSISMLEILVAAVIERFRLSRMKAAFCCLLAVLLLGALCAVSVSDYAALPQLEKVMEFFSVRDGSVFNFVNNFTSNWVMPIGGLLFLLFSTLVWKLPNLFESLVPQQLPGNGESWFYLPLRLLMTFVSPVLIIVVFLHVIGILKF